MSQIEAIQHAIEFTERNLQKPISVAGIAEAASYSVYHFCRVFSRVAHHSPYDYLMRRRLSEAARALVESDRKIIDIALDYQFNSPETFSRAFKRMFDRQPNQWRKEGILNRRFLLSPFSLAYLQHINRGDCLKPVFAQKKAVHMAGLMIQITENEPERIARLWKVLKQELSNFETISPPKYYGITWYPSGSEQNGAFYMAGAEIKTPDVTHPGLISKTVPSQTYARFTHRGGQQTRCFTLDYVYQTWLPQSGKRLAFPMEIESFGETCPVTEATETGIYIPLNLSSG